MSDAQQALERCDARRAYFPVKVPAHPCSFHMDIEDYDAIKAHIAALQSRIDALTADAERYRWLRDPDSECNVEIPTTHAGYLYPGHGAALDAAIDAARQQEPANGR